jgi:hypothetical protein
MLESMMPRNTKISFCPKPKKPTSPVVLCATLWCSGDISNKKQKFGSLKGGYRTHRHWQKYANKRIDTAMHTIVINAMYGQIVLCNGKIILIATSSFFQHYTIHRLQQTMADKSLQVALPKLRIPIGCSQPNDSDSWSSS